MKQFSELGLTYKRKDGLEFADVECLKLSEIAGDTITVKRFILNANTRFGDGRTVVIFDDENGVEKKFITASQEITQLLIQAKGKDMLPFKTTIKRKKTGQYDKYIFT